MRFISDEEAMGLSLKRNFIYVRAEINFATTMSLRLVLLSEEEAETVELYGKLDSDGPYQRTYDRVLDHTCIDEYWQSL